MNICLHKIFLCMGAWTDAPVKSHFLLNHDWPISDKPEVSCLPWIIIPLQHTLPGYIRALNFSDEWTAWGIHQNEKEPSNNWGGYNLGTRSTVINRFHLTQNQQNMGRTIFSNPPGDLCWLYYPRWIKHHPLGLTDLQGIFNMGKTRTLLVDHTAG